MVTTAGAGAASAPECVGEHRDEHRVDRDAHAGTWRSRQQEHQRSRHAVRDFGQVFEALDVVRGFTETRRLPPMVTDSNSKPSIS